MITVTWNAKDGTTQIQTARSRDGGRTFADEMNLQTKGAIGDRGWQASAIDSRGGCTRSGSIIARWPPPRRRAHAEHKGEHDGVAMAQKSGLYYAADGVPERELFKGVCYCCKTAMATGPKGEIYAAWRHVFAGNMRDMGFTMSRDGGKTFAPLMRVNQDGWSIQGCPDDGPAMAVDAKGHGASRVADREERARRDPLRHVEERRRVLDAGSLADARWRRSRRIRKSRSIARAACSWRGTRCATASAARRSRRSADRKSPDILDASTSYPVMAPPTRPRRRVDLRPADRSTIGVRVIQELAIW